MVPRPDALSSGGHHGVGPWSSMLPDTDASLTYATGHGQLQTDCASPGWSTAETPRFCPPQARRGRTVAIRYRVVMPS